MKVHSGSSCYYEVIQNYRNVLMDGDGISSLLRIIPQTNDETNNAFIIADRQTPLKMM